MVNIQLSAPSLHPWTATPEGYARGYAFAGKDLLRGEALIGYARQALSDSGPGALPERLNGHFALILRKGGETWLIADKLKSFPLFYYADGGGFTVCDRGEYVRGHIPDATLDTDVLPHFLGLQGVEMCQAVSDLLTFCLAIPLTLGVLKEMKRKEGTLE